MLGFNKNSAASEESTVPEYLQSITVKIRTSINVGSGVVFTRKDSTGTNNISFVWSVGHLFEDEFESTVPIDFKNIIPLQNFLNNTTITFPKFTNKTIIDIAFISQDIITNGEIIGTNISTIKLIKYSETGEDDITLSLIETNFFNSNTVKFDLSGKIPKLGDKIYNASYPYGEMNFSEGNISFIGRKIGNYVFDQSSCVVYAGSSGGGYFTTNGLCIGLVDMTSAASINYMIPIRRIRRWAKENNIEWALDSSIPIPPKSQIEKMNLR